MPYKWVTMGSSEAIESKLAMADSTRAGSKAAYFKLDHVDSWGMLSAIDVITG